MENKEEKQQPVPIEKKWHNVSATPYIIAGPIIGTAHYLITKYVGEIIIIILAEIIIIILAVVAGFLYYPLKSKTNIKNSKARIVVTYLILCMAVGLLGGFSIGLINGLMSQSGNQQRIVECKGICNYGLTTKAWKYDGMTDTGRTVEPIGVGKLDLTKYGGKIILPSKYFQTQEQCIDYCLTQ